jgi:1-acyl-sn-glycerol-3-phosphate acyltransferase
MEPVYSSVIGFARGVFAVQGLKFTVLGDDNVPRSGGAVMTINHTGYMDFAYAGLAAQKSDRLVRFMAKDGVFSHAVSGPLMRGMKHIPVDRAAGAASYAAALHALRSGEIVGVFPEATISRSFELKEFKTGAARMAAEAQVPIVPLIVWGAQRRWTKDHPRNMGRKKIPVTVAAGPPLYAADTIDETNAAMREAMTKLLYRVQEEYPHPEGAYWVPHRLGGSAPTMERAKVLEEAELAQRARKRAEREAKSHR